jgi:hypothetical protein
MAETQILKFVEWSSPALSNARPGLSCDDAMVEHASMPPSESRRVFEMNLLIQQNEWTEMTFLAAFLRVMRPDVSRTALCGTPVDGFVLCSDHVLQGDLSQAVTQVGSGGQLL